MSRSEWPDLSCLASLARSRDLDVRPVLLRVHTDLFVAAPTRDRETIGAFEALALGFLPTVDDATAAIIAHKLAPVPDTPATIIDALLQRGGEVRRAILARSRTGPEVTGIVARRGIMATPHGNLESTHVDELLAMRDADVDLALARNRRVRFGSSHIQELVERGRERPLLALALLERNDLGVGDEAILYLHADDTRRKQIRARLESAAALTGNGALPRPDQRSTDALLAYARASDMDGFETQLALMLRLCPTPAWRFHAEGRRELLALALVAAGIAPDQSIRIFLTLHPTISRSTATVFRLAEVARNVARPVASHLIEAILGVSVETKREGRYVPAMDPSGTPARGRAVRPTLSQIRAAVLARRAG